MAEACQVDEWNRTALLACLIANPNRDTKKRPKPFEVVDFHPYVPREKKPKKSAAKLLEMLGGHETVTEETAWLKVAQEQ